MMMAMETELWERREHVSHSKRTNVLLSSIIFRLESFKHSHILYFYLMEFTELEFRYENKH